MNNYNAIGRVGRDCEIRFTDAGDPIGSWSMAIDYGYGKNAGTLWVNCSLFGKRAESLKQYILKGTQLGFNGEIFMREYVTKDGVTKTSLECRVSNVSLVGSKSVDQGAGTPPQNKGAGNTNPEDFEQMADGIPF